MLPALPGDFLHRIAKRSCSTTTCERVIEPLIADLQREWLSAGRPARRAVARIRGYASFWQTLLLCSARATPRMLATWPLPIAMRTAVMVAFCVAVVIGVGWFKTGGISWREGIREPNLVGFWLGLFWPMFYWWPRPAGARRLLLVVAFGFELAILYWLYPTRIDQIVIMSVTYAVVAYFIGRARTRGRNQGDQTRLGL
jgi:hypothetical protein